MFKKFVAWGLIFLMLLQISILENSFAIEDTPSPRPEVTYMYYYNWDGNAPVEGNSNPFIEVRGYGLADLDSIKVNLYEKPEGEYVQVATSIESTYLGINRNGEDVYILKTEFQEGKSLENTTYYIEVIDVERDITLTSVEQFFTPNPSQTGQIKSVSITEMADNVDSIFLEVEVEYYMPGRTKEDFIVELVQGEVGYTQETTGIVSKIGTLDINTLVLDELENGIYSLKGEFSISSALNPDEPVYVKVVGPGQDNNTEIAYGAGSDYWINIISTSSSVVKNLEISNSLTVRPQGHYFMESENQQSAKYYISQDETELNFSFDSTSMPNSFKIDLHLMNNGNPIGELDRDTLNVEFKSNGLYRVSGTMNLSSQIESLSTSIDMEDSVNGTVYGEVYDQIQLTSLQLGDNSDLEIYYDNNLIETGTIITTTLRGAEFISYEGSISSGFEPYFLHNNDFIELTLVNALNLNTDLITGQLVKYDDFYMPVESISLSTITTTADNDIQVKFTPDTTPSGIYQLKIAYDGDSLVQLSEYGGELTVMDPFFYYSPMEFNFTDDNRSELISIDNDNNTLEFNGKRFSLDKSYKAYFLKHSNSSLTAEPFEINVVAASSKKLTISSTNLADFPRGWYTVYVKEDGEYIKGFSDVSLLNDEASSSIILPTAKINNDEEYTLTPEVTLNITTGSFNQVKIASTQEGLVSASWQSIASEIPFTLEGDYGVKTIYFLFRTSSGFEYSLTDTITYRGDFLDDMLDYGILGSSVVDEIVNLHENGEYIFYIQAKDRDLTGYIEFLDDSGDIIRTEILKRTSGAGLVHTYSKFIKIKDILTNTKTVKFYVMDGQSFTSAAEEKSVNISEEAFISSYQSKLKTKWIDKQYILLGSEMSFTLKGTPLFNGSVTIYYNKLVGEAQKTISLTEINEGIYEGTINVPEDATKITKFVYTLVDSTNTDNSKTTEETKDLDVTSTVRFTGLENGSGDYNGKILAVNSYFNWFNEDILIENDESSLTIEGLQPNILYNYLLSDDNRTYELGSFTTEKGNTETINLGNAERPAKVTFNLVDVPDKDKEFIKLFIKMDYYPYKRYVKQGESITGFVKDESITYGIELNEITAKKYKSIFDVTTSIDTIDKTINIELEDLETVTLSGTILDERIPDETIENANINIQQQITNGSHTFKYITNAVTDEKGTYSAEVYPDAQMLVTFSKAGYITKHQNLTISEDYILDNNLELTLQNRILVQPFSRPILKTGEKIDDSQLQSLDMYKIKYIALESMDGERIYAPFYRQTGYIDLTYANVEANMDIKVIVSFFDEQIEEEFYIVNLNEYKNGTVKPIAVPRGELSADIVISGGNTPYAYMIPYDNNGKQVAYIESHGAINTKQMKIEPGNYLAYFFKGFDLGRLKEYKNFDSFELLDLKENIEYVKKNVTITNGRITDLGEIEIPEILSSEKLGTSNTRISTRFVPNSSNGELRVLAQIYHEGLGEEKEFNNVEIKTNGILTGSVYLDGEDKGTHLRIYSNNKIKSENTLYFTIIPSSVEQTYLSLNLEYDTVNSRVRETVSVHNLNVPEVTLIAPEEVFMGSAAKEVLVRGVSKAGSRIEIYANDQLIGEVTTPENRTSYQTIVELPNSSTPMVHLLYAKMITEDDEITTGYSICEVIDPSVMAYTSNFEFNNNSSYRYFTLDSPSESSYPLTLSYNPYYASKISFRINNLLEEDLDYVAFVNTYNGIDNYFDATHVEDVDDGNHKYSKWQVEAKIGMPGEFSVFYSLAEDTSLGPISGSKPIDFEKAIENTEIDPAYIPNSVLQSTGRTVTQKGENLEIVIPVSDTGYLRLEGSFKEDQLIDPTQLVAQGYTQINTLQGSYWTKETLEEIEGVTVFNKKLYFSPELTAILKSSTSPIIGKSVGSPLLAQVGQSDILYAQSSVDKALSMADYTGYVYNVADFTAHSGGNASGFGIGSKMQVLGGAVFVAQALSGPTAKDPNTLYQAVDMIKDPMTRSRLKDDIRQYSSARRSSHTVSTILNGASYGAGFGGLVGKGLSYVISTGSMVYGQKTGAELDIWWDAIMRDIQNEINLQEFRKNKGKKKPAKKDKIKKPKWKIDPSGYVFEAIDSNRIEGITAYAMVGDMETENSFVIWDNAEEWDEVNPDITDKDGKYGWDVPAGNWKVKFVGNDDYKTSYTQAMEVPPVHDQVNIGLLSKRIPNVVGVALDRTGLEIEFDTFMQIESIYNKISGINNILVYDSNNNLVPCENVEMIIGTEDTVYKEREENIYQADYIQSESFVKRVRFVVDETLYPGGFRDYQDDGETVEIYRVVINGNVQSYSGIRMDTEFEENSLEVGEKLTMESPIPSIPPGKYYSSQEVDFTTISGGTIYYTTDGTEPTTLSRVWNGPMDIDKTTTIKILASKVGYFDSEITSYEYRIEDEPIDMVAEPTANYESGTYSSSINVALSSSTEGSIIRYTLDGSIPTINSSIYKEPIRISESTTLRAFAMKDNYVNSSIATYNYTIKSSGSSSGSGKTTTTQSAIEKLQITAQNNQIMLELDGVLNNNQKLYNLSSDEVMELQATANSTEAEVLIINVNTLPDNVKQIYQIPISILREVKSINAIKLQSNYQLILNKSVLEEISLSEETNLVIEIVKEGLNNINITLKKDNKSLVLTQDSIILAIPHPMEGSQWVLIENEGTTKQSIISYSFYSDGYVWGKVKGTTKLALVNNLKSFDDISGGWFEESVIFVTSRELFRGTGDKTFTPNQPMTRGMLATVLYRLSKSESSSKSIRDKIEFKDVTDTEYYYDSVNWAYELGVISGMGDGRFAPNSNITREQLAVMLYNYSKAHNLLIPVNGSGIDDFNDSDSISDWAVSAVDYAVKSGLMRGKGNNILDPKGNATRAEVATMLQNFIKLYNKYPR